MLEWLKITFNWFRFKKKNTDNKLLLWQSNQYENNPPTVYKHKPEQNI